MCMADHDVCLGEGAQHFHDLGIVSLGVIASERLVSAEKDELRLRVLDIGDVLPEPIHLGVSQLIGVVPLSITTMCVLPRSNE